MTRTENLVDTLAELISDAIQYGSPNDAAKSILEDFATIPISELPEVQRSGGSLLVGGYTYSYGMVTEEALYGMALRSLAALRFLELEAEAKTEADRIEHDALLKEAYTLWAASTLWAARHPEPMAQWEFEIQVPDSELETWLNVARAVRKYYKGD